MKHLLLFLFLFPLTLSAQIDECRLFVFGHSLIDHRPPAIATPSDETTVPHWLQLLSAEANKTFAAGGQYGFLPQHANLPPFAQWGYDIVPGVWDSDVEPFADADISHALITAGNFIQWQGPEENYYNESFSPIDATVTILDWLDNQEDGMSIYIYENWPDMAGYIAGELFPPTAAEYNAYSNYTLNEFHDWWINYHDALLSQRPEINTRMIPVGPIIANLFMQTAVGQVPITELYEDNAPHGRASLYFLASLVTYMSVYAEPAPSTFTVPSIVHPEIQNNYQSIVDFIWNDLQAFNDNTGNSRVFYSNPVMSADVALSNDAITVFPNPNEGLFHIVGEIAQYNIDVLDSNGGTHGNYNSGDTSLTIDLSDLPTGLYFIRISKASGELISLETILKYD